MKGQLQLFEPLKKSQCSNYGDFDWPPFCYDLSFGLVGSFQLIEVGRWVAVLISRISYPALRFSAVKPVLSLSGLPQPRLILHWRLPYNKFPKLLVYLRI